MMTNSERQRRYRDRQRVRKQVFTFIVGELSSTEVSVLSAVLSRYGLSFKQFIDFIIKESSCEG